MTYALQGEFTPDCGERYRMLVLDTRGGWTDDPLRALRFSSLKAAERVRRRLGIDVDVVTL